VDYDRAVDYVFSFTNYEMVPLDAAAPRAFRLDRIRGLLGRLGEPQLAARSVHITGSKGKGSVATMVAALLRVTGARVGLFTSPHLHTPRERIAVEGHPISEDEFATLVSAIRPAVEAENAVRDGDALTTFELLTALAFLAFRERRCDWQVIEVGLGGTLDATNVLDEKELCVFTPISLEHTAILGPTTAAIASDKAGILRRGCRAVSAPQDDGAGAVLRDTCAEQGVPLRRVDCDCRWESEPSGLDGQRCRVWTPQNEYRFFLPLLGAHQVENAAAALLSVEQLAETDVVLAPAQAEAALSAVRWPGRLELLARVPAVLVDGAHNAASAKRLAAALRELLPPATRLTLIVGTLADKDLDGIAAALAPIAAEVIAVQPDQPRSRPVADVARAFEIAGARTRSAASVALAVRDALANMGSDGAICVTGSLSVAAEARAEVLGAAV